jgi:hypothetical protein
LWRSFCTTQTCFERVPTAPLSCRRLFRDADHSNPRHTDHPAGGAYPGLSGCAGLVGRGRACPARSTAAQNRNRRSLPASGQAPTGATARSRQAAPLRRVAIAATSSLIGATVRRRRYSPSSPSRGAPPDSLLNQEGSLRTRGQSQLRIDRGYHSSLFNSPCSPPPAGCIQAWA